MAEARGRPGNYLVVRTEAGGRVSYHGPMYSAPSSAASLAESEYGAPGASLALVPWSKTTAAQRRLLAGQPAEDSKTGNGNS